ncbi:hypothetical protein [uncultured Clostridium sp.]|uniref:hypothetical protein n=1 Tax=uncultured Clostridium sp. TaxID=59620 RepID=UPI0025E7A9D7|nr:hypothetical protein [uncultured Clostridium sp.]
MRERIINGINCESIESFIAIYNCSRKYCIDKIDEIRFKYKEMDNKLNSDLNYKILSGLKDEILKDSIRIDILKNILISLEKYNIQNEELCKKQKEFIKEIYRQTIIDYKKYRHELKNEIDIVCKNEIRKLDYYIDSINIEEAKFDYIRLFYRRVLTENEYCKKKKEVLTRVDKFKNCKSIKEEIFIKDYKDMIYSEIENKYKNEYIYELNLSDYSYILEVGGLKFTTTSGFNTYWFHDKLDWVIERNHEGWYHIYF